MMEKQKSPEITAVEQRRKAAMRQRWRQRLEKWAWYGVLAEAFFLPLFPSLATVALLVTTVITALRFRIDEELVFRQLPFDVPVGLFVLLSALSILVSPDKGFSFYNWYNLVGVYVLTYLVVGQNLRSVRQIKEILAVSAVAAVLVLLYGFHQFLFGIDISSMKWVDGEAFPELRKRVFSTWENPNILAGYLDAIICIALGLFLKCGTRQKRIVLGVFMASAAACLAMTYARGACLVIAIIFAVYGMLKDWRVLLACVAVGAVLLLSDQVLYERLTSVFTKVDTSSEMRLAFWESTVAMIQDHPFLGIGWGAYWMVYPEYDFYLQGADIRIVHAHNLYLNYMAEIGIPGAISFFWLFFGSMWLALWQKFKPAEPVPQEPTPFDYNAETAADVELKKVADSVQTDDLPQEPPVWKDFCDWQDYRLLGGLSLGLGLAMISVALNGFTDDLLFNIPTSMFLWTLLAMIAAVAEFNQPAEEESEPAPVEEHISDWGNALGTDASPEKTEDDPFAKMYADPVPEKKQAEVKAETKAAAQTEPVAEEKAAAKAEKPAVETALAMETAPATETVETAEKAEKAEKAAASEGESQSPAEVKDEVKNEVKDAKVQLKTTGEEKHDEKSDDHIKGDH